MTKNDVYIWYSGATDITGEKLVKELGVKGGKECSKDAKIIIGWGAKTKKDMLIDKKVKTLNHPNDIRKNRNKHTTLCALDAHSPGKFVASYVTSAKVMEAIGNKDSPIHLPLVGRTNFHQGGKGFFLCLTKYHIDDAIANGADYFQNYIHIKDEYRLHIFDGKLIYAQKKVKRNDVEEAYKSQHAEKIVNIAKKQEKDLHKDTMDFVLERIAKENKIDMIIRSNRKGWKFSHVTKVDKFIEELAVEALKIVNLDFGAVDCCRDENEVPWIIEINSGPSLEGSTFKTYTNAFGDFIEKAITKKSPAKKKIKSRLGAKTAKERLTGIQELLDIVADADENEAMIIEDLLKKKLGA